MARFSIIPVVALASALAAPIWAQDVRPDSDPGSTAGLEWQGYAARWGQVVTENGIQRPGINTIYDTLRVQTDQSGQTELVRTITWRDIHSAWISFAHTMSASMAPRKYFQIDNTGDLQAFDWSEDGTVKGFGYDGESGETTWSSAGRPDGGWGFFSGQYGLEYRAVAPGLSTGRIQTSSPWSGSANWTDFTITDAEPVSQISGAATPTRLVTVVSSQLTSRFWISDTAPYVRRVRFEQDTGVVTEWVLTAVELLGN